MAVAASLLEHRSCVVMLSPNKLLQRTFDPLPIFAAAKTGVASNAPELRLYGPPLKRKAC